MSVTLSIQNIAQSTIPSKADLSLWIEKALQDSEPTVVNVRIVDSKEIQALNQQYRNKDKSTNVLSFPNLAPKAVSDGFLGDIVICTQVLEQEAHAQNKPLEHHWAHLIIHSTLHLQGFDHETDDQAKVMEALEIQLLAELGIDNPYVEENHE